MVWAVTPMPHPVRHHLLSIAFGVIFLLALIGQSFAGLAVYNDERQSHDVPLVTYGEFVTSSAFVVDVAENWQSEYLQFFLFILATVWLVQRGSPESKKVGDEGVGTDKQQLVGTYATEHSPPWAKADGWRRVVFSNSLLLVMGAIFFAVGSMVALSIYLRQRGSAESKPVGTPHAETSTEGD
jgi:hypothetical protein